MLHKYIVDSKGDCVNVKFDEIDLKSFSSKANSDYCYIIRSGTVIEQNLGYVSGTPQFDINRWIIWKDGSTIFKNSNNSMPFGTGKRDCVGKLLAMRELYGFLANLFVNYKFEPSKGKDPNTIEIKYVQELVKRINNPVPLHVEKRKLPN